MIRSMTGYARQESSHSWGTLSLELRSVNHRYLELGFRLPEELRCHEARLREQLQQHLQRGKVDCNVRFQSAASGILGFQINQPLVEQLARACDSINRVLHEHSPVNALEVLRWPEVLQTPTVEPEVLQQTLMRLLQKALHEMIAMREREGDKLQQLLLQRLHAITQVVANVRAVLPEIRTLLREKLQARIRDLSLEVNSERIDQELVLLVQKMDVDEELDRLNTHISEVRHVLNSKEPVGRRLDFLMQEFNREANTLGSKSADVRTSNAAVDLKVLIEQMREQVQNIE
ncbi:MAG: YicC family protein [Gammaproteobacteria bacterium]|nr:YicC family protein [Gammaproteobacteria bacterium]